MSWMLGRRGLALRSFASFAIGVVGLGLLGCGSSSPSAKEELIAKADGICAHFAKRIVPDKAATRKAMGEKNLDRVAATLHRTARDTAREYNRLNNLEAPPGDELTYARMLKGIEAEALATNEYAVALEIPGPSETSLLTEAIESNAKQAQRIGQRYGFHVCGATK